MTKDSFASFVDDLIEDDIAQLNAQPTKTASEYDRKQFPCESCGGSGLWRGGRRNVHGNHKCNACRGLGYFVTSKGERLKAAAARTDRKRSAIVGAQADNEATGLVVTLSKMSDWNDFARSLMEQHAKGRVWSPAQVAAAQRMVDKVEAARAAKAAAKEEAAVTVDLAPIVAMFETALGNGYKKPMYRALGLRIKPGKGGALYVMTEDRMELGHYGEQPGYEGKIADGKFHPVRATAPETSERLLAIAADPRGEAVRHGQRTGTCSCCGRELTKHTSIDAGIGPICAEKWGL